LSKDVLEENNPESFKKEVLGFCWARGSPEGQGEDGEDILSFEFQKYGRQVWEDVQNPTVVADPKKRKRFYCIFTPMKCPGYGVV
jgi:hypothetical protein